MGPAGCRGAPAAGLRRRLGRHPRSRLPASPRPARHAAGRRGRRGRGPLPRYALGPPPDQAPGRDLAGLRRRRLPRRPAGCADLRPRRRRHRGEDVGADAGHRHLVGPARVVRRLHPPRPVGRLHRRPLAGQPRPGYRQLRARPRPALPAHRSRRHRHRHRRTDPGRARCTRRSSTTSTTSTGRPRS